VRGVRNTASGLEVLDLDEPAAAGGVAVVDVAASGICGSDLHMLEWGALPATLGHEIGGHLADGTPVTVWPYVPCEECDRCRLGETQQCRTGTARIYGVSLDGGLADRIAVDARNALPLPAGLSPADAPLVEPIACSVHAFRRAGVGADDRVAVVGAGSIGLGAVSVAKHLGCTTDVAVRHEAQRRAAEVIGVGTAPDGEYDVVVDAAGTSGSMARSIELLRPGGTVLIVSSQWSPVEFPAFFASKEPTFVTATMHNRGGAAMHNRGSGTGTTDMQASMQLLVDLPQVAEAMITHRFPLARAQEAFAAAADRSSGAIKVVLEP
jgi:threonine dehydrogenase-like Zn-dependent dehydrogenase